MLKRGNTWWWPSSIHFTDNFCQATEFIFIEHFVQIEANFMFNTQYIHAPLQSTQKTDKILFNEILICFFAKLMSFCCSTLNGRQLSKRMKMEEWEGGQRGSARSTTKRRTQNGKQNALKCWMAHLYVRQRAWMSWLKLNELSIRANKTSIAARKVIQNAIFHNKFSSIISMHAMCIEHFTMCVWPWSVFVSVIFCRWVSLNSGHLYDVLNMPWLYAR